MTVDVVFLVVGHSGSRPDDANVTDCGFCLDPQRAEKHRIRLQDLADREYNCNQAICRGIAKFRKNPRSTSGEPMLLPMFRLGLTDAEHEAFRAAQQEFLNAWAEIANDIRSQYGLPPFEADPRYPYGWPFELTGTSTEHVSWSVQQVRRLE